MGRTKRFSKIHFYWNKERKIWNKEKHDNMSKIEMMEMLIKQADKEGENIHNSPTLFGFFKDGQLLKNEKVQHYFIDDYETFNFLCSMDVKNETDLTFLLEQIRDYSQIIIHHKDSRFTSIRIFPLSSDYENVNQFVVVSDQQPGIYLRMDLSSYKTRYEIPVIVPNPEDRRPVDTKLGIVLQKFLINFLMYMNTYPELIREGTPDVSIDINARKRKNIIVHRHKELIGHGVTPHLRRGHFRVLKSERFTHKRYKTIFVRSSFVRGTASHIEKEVSI